MHLQPPAPTAADAAVGPTPASGRRAAAVSTLLSSGVSVAITVAQAFVVIPLALLHIGPVIYGGWIAASEVLIWLQLLDFGVPNLAAQRVGAALGSGDTRMARRWATSSILAVSLISAVLTLLVLFLTVAVVAWARVPTDAAQLFAVAFVIATLASGMLMWYHGVLGIARGAQRTTFLSVVQVVAALAGFFVSVSYLAGGYHVLALAYGLAARGVICAGGAFVFLLCGRRVNGVGLGLPSFAALGEIMRLAPALTGANLAYLVSNHTEVALVTTVFGPGAAAVYSLTRRAFDGLRQLLDVIAFSVYGGFAHLVAAADKHRARTVLNEILLARLAVAALAAAIAAAVNRPFVALLFGPENYGGGWLNAGFAVQLVIGGQAFLCSYLLRAAGRIGEGSAIAALEAIARVAAIGVALLVIGPASVPWAAALASVGAAVVAQRRLSAILPPAPPGLARERRVRWSIPALAVAGGIALGLAPLPRTWLTVLVLSAVVLGGGGLLLRSSLPGTTRAQLDRWLRWLMASTPPPPSSPPGRISTFWRLLPGAVFLTYFVSTVLLFFFGPWNYRLGPGIGRLIFFLTAVHTVFAAGYWLGTRGRPAAARLPVQVGTVVFAAAVIELLLIVPTSLHNTGRWIPMPWSTLQDMGGAYTGSILRREAQTPYVNYVRILLSPLLTVAVPLGVFYWRRLARVTRLVLIASVIGTIGLYIDIGASAGLAHWVGLFPWLIIAAHLSGVQRLDRARWTRLGLVLAASGLVFSLVFGTAMVNRRGSYAVYGFLPGIGAHVDLPFVPQPAAVIAARGLAAYVTQGYYAVYLSLREPFVPCYGVGNSVFLQRQAARVTGNAYFLSCSYPTRIESKGWHALRYWATIYPWLASDVTFPGTIVVIFVLGWLVACVWRDVLGGANPFAVAFLGQLLLVLYYVPAHNKLMQTGEGAFGFVVLLALWAVTRGWRRRA